MLNRVCKNCKLEFIIIILSILVIFTGLYFTKIEFYLGMYFTESRSSGIVSIAAINIGIYVSIWSIFSTSIAKINQEILKTKSEKDLFLIISVGIIECILTTIWCIFVPNFLRIYNCILLFLVILTCITFFKFIQLIMIMTRVNVNYLIKEIDESNNQKDTMMMQLDEIYNYVLELSKK